MTPVRWLPRFQNATRAIQVLAQRERWSRPRIEAFQLERLNHLWQHATAYVPHYRQLADQRTLPARFSSLDEFSHSVPVLLKACIKQDSKSFLSSRADRGSWKYTGGSTGTPTPIFWSHQAHLESLRAKYRFQAQWGVDIFDRTAFLWSHGSSVAPGWRGRWSRFRQPYMDRLRNRLRLSAYDVSRDSLRRYLHQLQKFDPVMIYGYSRALYLLAMEARQSGHWRFPSLKVIVATSEPAWPHMVQTIEEALGAPVAREYGATECGVIACDGPQRVMRVREDHVLLETLGRQDGQFDIVVTVLNNPSFPLIRYAIGDVTSAELVKPAQGFESLADVGGRNNDLLRSKTGDYLHWVHIEHAVAATAARVLRRFSIYQAADGSVRIDAELHDPAGAAQAAPDLEAFRRFFEARLGGFPVALRVVPAVQQTLSGKHRVVCSDLYDLNTSRSFRPAPAAEPSQPLPV
ncbi:MAG TPA: AMP-binding protein [Tepidisphaeraceae bacterium]|jgi:phenylacetate-CoA ligase|nr:AMP-binding protein [Tepidisphaeraceae bacterium]